MPDRHASRKYVSLDGFKVAVMLFYVKKFIACKSAVKLVKKNVIAVEQ